MEKRYTELIDKLQNGQAYLFLGQEYLMDEVKKEFYENIKESLGLPQEANSNLYLGIEDLKGNSNDVLSWIQTKADYVTLPSWSEYISKIRWNGVITSSVEYFIEKIFTLGLRDIQPVYQYDKGLPYNFRSSQVLHISYLYGCLNQNAPKYRPPLSPFDMPAYRRNASELLNRIDKEFLTPLGIIIVDGYDCDSDWLKGEEFYALCDGIGKNRVYYFGFKDQYLNNRYIERLVNNQIIIPFKEPLYSFLMKCDAEDLLEKCTEDESIINDVIISFNNKKNRFPANKIKKMSSTFMILDDLMFEFDEDEEDKTDLFREFLYDSSIKPVWYAYQYKMNIERDYEKKALDKINEALNKEGLSKKPIVIYGQTGTGKSVAMGNFAYKIKKQNRYPVIYISSKTRSFRQQDILEYCEMCNDAKIAIFWDASTHGRDHEVYVDLNNYLSSKGKKAVVIGTSYSLNDEIMDRKNVDYIEAPVELNPDTEVENFKRTYEEYTNNTLSKIWNKDYDNNFLVSLYRLLPRTKYNIRKGLLEEISGDTVIFDELDELKPGETEISKLLRKLNIPISSDDEQTSSNEVYIKGIIEIVSVIGQYGIGVPFDIIYRVMHEEVSYLVGKLLGKIDYLHVETNYCGDIYIWPRTSLEAKIVSDSSITIDRRVGLIKEIIMNVSEKEVLFLVDLLKAIGPNGDADVRVFRDYYMDIALAVADLRIHHGIYNSATVLQEASYTREYFKTCENKDKDISVLLNVQEVLVNEINKIRPEIESSYSAKRIYGQLLIELSSNIGTEIKYYCDNMYSSSLILETNDKLDKYLDEALLYSPDPYYPVDILAWSFKNVYNANIGNDRKIEQLSKILSLFDRVAMENPGVIERNDYNKRLLDISTFSDMKYLSDEVFERLIAMESDAGIYLRTKEIIKDIDLSKRINDQDIESLRKAIIYLENDDFKDIVLNSISLQYLLLRLYWLVYAKEPIFYSEKKVLPFSRDIWNRIYIILTTIEELAEEVSSQIHYLIGVCKFHLDDVKGSIDQFKCIMDMMGARRPILYYIASDLTGQSKAHDFTGQLKNIEPNKGRANFYIPEIRLNLYYYNREFINRDPQVNQQYKVHIGFSFMGLRVSDLQ